MIPAAAHLLSAATLAASPGAVTLFTQEPAGTVRSGSAASVLESASAPQSLWLWLVIAAVILGISAAISINAWRGRWRDPPATRAASALARSLALSADQRRMLDRLAQALAAQPVALLISESAFERAIAALEKQQTALDPREKASLLALRAAVFGGTAGSLSKPAMPQRRPENPPVNLAA